MYRINIIDGIIRSIESFNHYPNYQPQEGEIFVENELPVPSTPIYDMNGKIIDATSIPYEEVVPIV